MPHNASVIDTSIPWHRGKQGDIRATCSLQNKNKSLISVILHKTNELKLKKRIQKLIGPNLSLI